MISRMRNFINRIKNSELYSILVGEDWPRVTREESRQYDLEKQTKEAKTVRILAWNEGVSGYLLV
jgi:hypothetical protein